MKADASRTAGPLFILTILTLLHAAITLASDQFGGGGWTMFVTARDFFGDSIKSGLAQTAVSDALLHDPRVQQWPALFQHYLFHNDYLQPGMSIDHSPPLSALLLMGVAAMLRVLSPPSVIALLVGLYVAAAGAVSRAVEVAGGARDRWLWPLMILAYPAMFMLDRGNLHSGLTSACVIFYVVSARHGRWTWAGWLALAVAVNLRPNVAIFALMELCRGENRWHAMLRMIAAGLLSIGLLAACFGLVRQIDPHYSIESFSRGYALYHRNYVEGIEGLAWNGSLFNIVKTARFLLGEDPLFSPGWSTALGSVGVGVIVLTAALGWFRRLSAPRLAFALASICGLFTPVLGAYHLLVFVAPLVLLLRDQAAEGMRRNLTRGAIWLAIVQALCLAFWLVPAPPVLAALVLVSLGFPLLLQRTLASGGTRPQIDIILALACVAMLAPLGDELTNGLALGLIGGATLAWLLVHSLVAPHSPDAIQGRAGGELLTTTA